MLKKRRRWIVWVPWKYVIWLQKKTEIEKKIDALENVLSKLVSLILLRWFICHTEKYTHTSLLTFILICIERRDTVSNAVSHSLFTTFYFNNFGVRFVFVCWLGGLRWQVCSQALLRFATHRVNEKAFNHKKKNCMVVTPWPRLMPTIYYYCYKLFRYPLSLSVIIQAICYFDSTEICAFVAALATHFQTSTSFFFLRISFSLCMFVNIYKRHTCLMKTS